LQEFRVNSIQEYDILVQEVLEHKACRVLLLRGELGSGKTTFTNKFIQTLGFPDSASSPTFSLVNVYEFNDKTIYHFDLYRIKDVDELLDLGFEEYLDAGNYIIIEWPDLAIPLLHQKYLSLEFHILNSTSRKITLALYE